MFGPSLRLISTSSAVSSFNVAIYRAPRPGVGSVGEVGTASGVEMITEVVTRVIVAVEAGSMVGRAIIMGITAQ